jgi:hypothetical protein
MLIGTAVLVAPNCRKNRLSSATSLPVRHPTYDEKMEKNYVLDVTCKNNVNKRLNIESNLPAVSAP